MPLATLKAISASCFTVNTFILPFLVVRLNKLHGLGSERGFYTSAAGTASGDERAKVVYLRFQPSEHHPIDAHPQEYHLCSSQNVVKIDLLFAIVKIPSTYHGKMRFVLGCKILHRDMAVSFPTRLQKQLEPQDREDKTPYVHANYNMYYSPITSTTQIWRQLRCVVHLCESGFKLVYHFRSHSWKDRTPNNDRPFLHKRPHSWAVYKFLISSSSQFHNRSPTPGLQASAGHLPARAHGMKNCKLLSA